MKILLVGATGTLGRQVAKQAIEDGHEVRCFVRNPRKASFLQEWGCELTKGNLLNSSDIEYSYMRFWLDFHSSILLDYLKLG